MAHEERGDLIVGLDIGTTKICVVVGEVHDTRIDIIGIGRHPSVGLRRGVVVNIESTVHSIRQAVEEAERMAGCEIGSVYVGIAGSHIKSFNSHGLIAIKHNEIRQDDQEFMVDGQADIQDPIGMTGVRLEADVHIVTGSATAVHNIVKCCNRAGLQVTDVVLEPLASAGAVLTREEMELGVGLLDIGGGTADLAIFADGTIKHTFVLGLGGQNLTNDLSIGLRTPQKEAERLKEEYGSALASLIDKDQVIEVPSVGGRKNRKLSRRVMGEILEPRVEEMLTLINQELLDSKHKEMINAGMVLTGGSCLLDNMEELAEQIFDLPVRIGRPENIGGVVDVVGTPQWATGVGLVVYGMKNGPGERFKRPKGGVVGRFTGRMKDWFKGIV
ncbi:MAG: cell division protein FtsA [Deltaproteobacteria bacterium HGW-Deltaproteobacteria-3]|nr:MAG: cell division protein FtsA [Deltaproteobacteria bacterium HGW-Deltaproteobacteria-3]